MPFKDLKARLLGLKKKDKPQQTEQVEPASANETQSATSSAAATPKAEISFEDGVIALHPNLNAIVDICFVHGLTGNRESTWTADGQSRPWPETLLSKFLDKARIITYGYDAYVVRGVTKVASGNRLIDHATNFLNDLSTDRAIENASSRPIIFVAHSLGGLVCKEALLLSRNNPEPHLKSLFTSTKAVAFMGTPHTGSWMADWSTILATALGIVKSTNKSLLEILETDDQFLESIQVGFLSMIRGLQREGRQLEITCFYEELPLPVIGRKVVSKDSATFAGYNPISIHANHRNMVKFASEYENGFKRLLGELVRWQSEIR